MLDHDVSRETLKLLSVTKTGSKGEKTQKPPKKQKKRRKNLLKPPQHPLNTTQKAHKNRKCSKTAFAGIQLIISELYV